MKIACLYLTYKKSACLHNLQTLVTHINSYKEYQIDLYIYNNNEESNDIIYDNNYCEFSFNVFRHKYNYIHNFDKDKQYIGNCQLPLIDLWINHQEYDKFIFYEDDVAYIGNNNMFDLIDFNKDVVFPSKRIINNYWHWQYIENNLSYNNDNNKNLYSGLLNIYMLSSNVIQKIYEFMCDGNYAHHEYLINSYIMENYEKYNWEIVYLYGNNEFKVYENELKHTGKDFVHPIKNIMQLEKYKKYK